jgi:phage baseplate assembly protein W
MSSLGRTISQTRQFGKIKEKTLKKERMPIGIKTPLSLGENTQESLFKMNFEPATQIKDNLKNLIMTQKGERLGFPDFGTSLSTIYSNTQLTKEQIEQIIMAEISEAVEKYMPSVALTEFYSKKLSNEKNDPNNNADEFLSQQTQTKIDAVFSSKKLNDKNNTNESLYEVNILYNVPLVEASNELLTIYIKAAR